MSTFDALSEYTLKIIIDFEYRYLVKIFVFNSDSRIISPVIKSNDDYVFKLNKGLYTIRVEMNAEVNDKIITLNSDKKYFVTNKRSYHSSESLIEPPMQYSSALLEGQSAKTYSSSHEYYTNPAIDLSKRSTFNSGNSLSNDRSSLFIFLRFPSLEKYHDLIKQWTEPFYRYFEVINEYGERLIHFEDGVGIEVNDSQGWIAFNALLPNGIYYLIYHGVEPRQIPIYVFKNWHTQFFMTLGAEPLFGTIRIFISERRAFDPKEETNKYIDILLDKLQNRDYSVDKELIEITANGKYLSPMLGLICSYIYLKGTDTKNDRLFDVITQNMQNVILKDNDEAPDIRALNILAAAHYNTTRHNETAVTGTPMLRVGLEAILSASVRNKNLIAPQSVNDFISETLYYDSPFTTFKPIPYYKKPKSASELNMTEPSDSMPNVLAQKAISQEHIDLFENDLNPVKFSIGIRDYLEPNILNFINNVSGMVESKSSWVKNSISDILSKDNNPSIDEISHQLNLSGNTITRIFDTWNQELKTKDNDHGNLERENVSE